MNHVTQPVETDQTNDFVNPSLEFGKVIDLHPVYAAMAQAREVAEANGTEPADVVWDPAWPDLPVDNDDYWNDLVERNWETLSRWYSMSLWAGPEGKLLHFKGVEGVRPVQRSRCRRQRSACRSRSMPPITRAAAGRCFHVIRW